ncbi:MAG TPA: hypothetical protein PKB06_08380, partial [Actinotalea sp.]|nr:hypothetical protein [Actinotalea sp.]
MGGQPVWELGMEVAADQHAVTLVRLDPLALALDPALGHWATEWYRSAWGDEYRPRHGTTRHDLVLDVRSGRSSHGAMPWLGL